MSTKVQRRRDTGNEAWNELAKSLLRGDQQATIEAVRVVDFDSAPSPVIGAAVRAFALAIETEEYAGFAPPMWHMLRALAHENTSIDDADADATRAMSTKAFDFYDAVNAAGDAVLFDAAREEARERIRESTGGRALNEREWTAADLVMRCERRANELLEVAGELQDEMGASLVSGVEISEATMQTARAMLPKQTEADGQRAVVLAVRDLANALTSSVEENRARALDAIITLMLEIGLSRPRGGSEELPVAQLLVAARARKGLGGSWYVETMKLCVALDLMDASSLEGLDDVKRREVMPAFKSFKTNASRWLNGKRGAALSLVRG